MTARADVSRAANISREYDNITAALAMLGSPSLVQKLLLNAPGSAGVEITINLPVETLTSLLSIRQTALAASLSSLGVTAI